MNAVTLSPDCASIKEWMRVRVAEALQLQPADIDPEQPFTTYGLESIEAFSIAGDLADWLGRDLSATLLWEHPTIAALAQHLGTPEPATDSDAARQGALSSEFAQSSLRPIQPQGSRVPFYCVHAVGGSALSYSTLARHLGMDQPFYAFQAPLLAEGQIIHQSLEDMATAYINELREFQPQGPYLLGGRSFGGIVAFEMARQLHAGGQEVGLVALLDSDCPKQTIPRTSRWQLDLHLRNLLRRKPREQWRYMCIHGSIIRQTGLRRLSVVGRLLLQQEKPLPSEFHHTWVANKLVADNYTPRPYPGRVTMFQAVDRPDAFLKPDRGWHHVALGGVEIQDVPGDHSCFIEEPYVQVLAARLNECLLRAQRPPHGEAANS